MRLARLVTLIWIASIVCVRAQNQPTTIDGSRPINVLVLGDSLALCGFGKRLDQRFRADPRVRATFTYMACGTTPLSWLKEKPYASIQTRCGFWSIETIAAGRARELQDTYGMGNKLSPQPHPVPKIEELVARLQPDILIMQTGTNLFDLFGARRTVRADHDATAVHNFLVPFLRKAVAPNSPLKKIYWVAAPTSGRVSPEIQDFVFSQTRADLGNVVDVIDSRALVAYPYHHMEPDKEHFIGADMDQWADGVYEIVARDMNTKSIASLKPLSETAHLTATSGAIAAAPRKQRTKPLVVKATLVFKTPPISAEQLLPYQELLVGCVYDVKKVLSGEYAERQLLVMQPAYIALRPQRLDKLRVGKTYKLRLQELEGTAWETAKSRDDSGLAELTPLIRVEDERKYPGNAAH